MEEVGHFYFYNQNYTKFKKTQILPMEIWMLVRIEKVDFSGFGQTGILVNFFVLYGNWACWHARQAHLLAEDVPGGIF